MLSTTCMGVLIIHYWIPVYCVTRTRTVMRDLIPETCRLYIAQQDTNIFHQSIFHLMEILGFVDVFLDRKSTIYFLHRVMSGSLYSKDNISTSYNTRVYIVVSVCLRTNNFLLTNSTHKVRLYHLTHYE